MTQKEAARRWKESAQRSFSACQDMVKTGHYDWALFLGQLAIEKMLKGLVIETTDETPPYIHDLKKLSLLVNIAFTDEQLQDLAVITRFHVQARYDDIKYDLYKEATKEFTDTWMKKISDLFLWISKHY